MINICVCYDIVKYFIICLAIWLLPTQWKYGGWPRSGEIDLLESRGNVKYGGHNQIGVEQVSSALHFGPVWNHDPFVSSSKHNANGYDKDFHKYEFHWDESGIKFLVDGQEFGFVAAGDGFWKRGGFQGENIWASGTKMAPFDQEVIFLKIFLNYSSNDFTHSPPNSTQFVSFFCSLPVPFHHQFGCWWQLLP